jgi:hypothetical protein
VYVDYIEQGARNKFKSWDVRTITAADYTVEMEIKEDFYHKFIEEHGGSKSPEVPMAVHFKNWLTKKIEQNIMALPDQHYEEVRPDRINVVNITFAYRNEQIIRLLRHRGDAIKSGDWKTVDSIEKSINK